MWSLDVDPAERRVATGSADNELRLYSVANAGAEGERMLLAPSLLCVVTDFVTLTQMQKHVEAWGQQTLMPSDPHRVNNLLAA